MSTTISGSNGIVFPDATSMQTGQQQACKAWVNFNGQGTVAIRRAFNVSSITDNGTGDYTVNLTTAMPDVNGTITGATTETVGSFLGGLRCVMPSFSSTSSIRLGVVYTNGGTVDTQYIGIAVFR